MKTPVAAAMTCLALAAVPAAAAPITFNTTGAIVDYTVPVTGQYTITAVGGKGGDSVSNPAGSAPLGKGGLGAEAGGTFLLAQGEVLQILVGAAGTALSPLGTYGFGGGGGGSFVVGPGDVPLVVAGGGGGGGGGSVNGEDDVDALTTPNGGSSIFPQGNQLSGMGGTGGADGQTGDYAGGTLSSNGGRGFDSFPSNLGAGAAGGGGTAVYANPYPSINALYVAAPGGGGGGGYSGGGGGGYILLSRYGDPAGAGGGGGGGSYTAGADPFLLAGIGTGDGFVAIMPDAVAVPEPSALALFGMGMLGLCAVRQTRRR